jgi:hypothetical protein
MTTEPVMSSTGPGGAGHAGPGFTALSESRLWSGLLDFYSSKGPTAWPKHVPFHATSNAFIADAYANIVVRLVQDLLSCDQLERSEPLYVVELGAGSGRFSFLALTRLADLLKVMAPEFQQVVYVMTDFASSNLDAWRADEALAPFVEAGKLQFSLFDANRDTALAIDGAMDLTPDQPASNPVVVVANYVFDSLPQDLFIRREDGGLEEGLVEVITEEHTASMPDGGRQLGVSFVELTVPRYEDLRIERLLHPDHETRPGPFLVPRGALDCIDRLAALAPAGMVVVSADAGGQVGSKTQESIQMPADGYFHLPVDFELVARYARDRGASFVRPYSLEALEMVVFALGLDAVSLPEMGHAADTYFGMFGLATMAGMRDHLYHSQPFATVESVLALGAATRWDAVVFNVAAEFLIGEIQAGKLSPGEGERLEAGLAMVVEGYHPRVDPPETLVNVGLVLQALGSLAKAAEHYARSWQLFGPTADTAAYIAMCSLAADDLVNARLWLAKTLELNPQHVVARGWLAQLDYNESVAGSGSGQPEGGD